MLLAKLGAALIALVLAACGSGSGSGAPPTARHPSVPVATAAKPFAHIVVVVEENHSYGEIVGNPSAPYFNHLAHVGRSLIHMHAITHPSEPNYLALFSGSTHGLTDDSCPRTFASSNLGHQLLRHHRTFVGYAQGLPHPGSKVCTAGNYARKDAPWVDFSDLPARATSRPFRDFPRRYRTLPTVSFVVPDLEHDMHDGTIAQAVAAETPGPLCAVGGRAPQPADRHLGRGRLRREQPHPHVPRRGWGPAGARSAAGDAVQPAAADRANRRAAAARRRRARPGNLPALAARPE